VTKVLQS
jgi:hypothetical protein